MDLTLAKAFGLPRALILGENAKVEFRLDAYNIFNNLNFKADSISNNIANANFGQATQALGARVVTLGALRRLPLRPSAGGDHDANRADRARAAVGRRRG